MAITPQRWFNSLVDEKGNSYKWERGNLTTQGDPHKLENTYDGWREKVVNYTRSSSKFGLFRAFTLPIRFVTEGKKILQTLFYKFGVEAVCNLVILRRDPIDWIHKDFYIGECDFSKFQDLGEFVSIQISEGGLSKLLTANESTDYEIPIDVPEKVAVYMPGIPFTNNVKWSVYGSGGVQINGGSYTLPVAFISSEGTNVGFVTGNSPLQSLLGFDIATNDDRWILKCTSGTNVQIPITGKIKFSLGGAPSPTRFELRKQDNTIYPIVPVETLGPGVLFHERTFSTTVTMSAGDKLFPLGFNGVGAPIGFWESEINGTIKNSYPASTVSALTWEYVYKQLVSKVSGGKYAGASSLLANRTDLVLISGDALRGLPGAVIKTNLNDNFQSSRCVLNTGMDVINQTAVLEKLEYFFDNTYEIADLGEVSDFKVMPAEDLMYNTIDIGGQNQTYDDLNGKDETNHTHKYAAPITKVVKNINLVPKYRLDSYGAEFARINLTGKKTTDSGSDNDIWIIQTEEYAAATFSGIASFGDDFSFLIQGSHDIKPGSKLKITGSTRNNKTFSIVTVQPYSFITPYEFFKTVETTVSETDVPVTVQVIQRRPLQTYDSITGVLNSTGIFNVGLSSKRLFLEHGNYFHSIFDKQDNQKIKYLTSDKNAEMQSKLPGQPLVIEKADVTIGSLPAKLFLPVYFSFTTMVPVDLVELMATNSRGYFSFTTNGVRLKVFAWDISIKPGDNDVQEWKGLSCPDNDLTKLI